jgi:hypothetical protein
MMNNPNASQSLKNAIDSSSGRVEFLKQALTFGLAGIAGIAVLFTDHARIPADSLSKFAIFFAAIGFAMVASFAVIGFSAYANLLTATDSDSESVRLRAPDCVRALRNAARVVMTGILISLISVGVFAGYRLFFFSTAGTPGSAIETASTFVSKETKQPPETLHLKRVEADNDAFTVTYFVLTTNSHATVSVSKKDGSIIRMTQENNVLPKP